MRHMDSATQATTPTEGSTEEPQLQRGLKNRHLQLIAIGGAIGTGLFLGSGKTISLAGPSILLVYLIIGAVLFFVMRAMGGGATAVEPGLQVLRRLRDRPRWPRRRVLHGVDILDVLGRHR